MISIEKIDPLLTVDKQTDTIPRKTNKDPRQPIFLDDVGLYA
jgi:hypothetical protein